MSTERDAAIDAGRDAALAPGSPGDPCTTPADCASANNPFSALDPTACKRSSGSTWSGGYCVDFCTLPATPFVPPRLTRADCPAGSVCLPRWYSTPGTGERPDIGACLKECQVDSDCRMMEGYVCRHDFFIGSPPSTVSFQNGYCGDAHCRSRGCGQSFQCNC